MITYAVLKAAICGIVEGLTEFIPVSSTGHLIITQNLLGMTGKKDNAFAIFIQLGAILAVVWLYREKLFKVALTFLKVQKSKRLVINLIIGTLPAVVIGLPTESWIEEHLFKPIPVSMAFVLGGIAIILIEKWFTTPVVESVDDIPVKKALGVGIIQSYLSFSLGSPAQALQSWAGWLWACHEWRRRSFLFLAIPAMFGASIIKLAGVRHTIGLSDFPMFFTGFAVSFIVALFVIKALLAFVSRKSFVPFAWYRIFFGLFLLAYWSFTGNF